MKRACSSCGARVEARNSTGYCRQCWGALPMARKMSLEALRDFLIHVPAPELAHAINRQGQWPADVPLSELE